MPQSSRRSMALTKSAPVGGSEGGVARLRTVGAVKNGKEDKYSDPEEPEKKDSKIWGDISAMVHIVKSPYEQNESAEVGEKVFDQIKSLLIPSEEEEGDSSVSATSKKIFGASLAESLATASIQIGKSGMLYSPAWQEGKIRGMQCGYIPRKFLLLCLHEQRFVKANEAVLGGVIRDLGTWKLVKDGMKEWGLQDDYTNLASQSSYFVYQSQKTACCKCEVFVARARISLDALKRTKLDGSLMEKIKTCLRIMDDHVKVNKRELEKLEAQLEAKRMAAESSKRPLSKEDDGAEIVVGGPQSVSIESENSSHDSSEEVAVSKKQKKKKNPNKKRKPNEPEKSLVALVNKFEKQYQEMGETLNILKKKLRGP